MHVNLKAFDSRAGARGIIAIGLVLVLGLVFGQSAVIAALSAIFISVVDSPGLFRERLRFLGGYTLLLCAVTSVAWAFGGSMWPVVVSIFLVTFACGLALAYGPARAMQASLLNLWLIIMFPMVNSITLVQSVLETLCGGLLVIVVVTVYVVIVRRWRKGETVPASVEQPADNRNTDVRLHLTWKSPIFRYALVKALATSLATLVGWLLVGSHAFWATYAPLMIIKPDIHQSMVSGANRTVGTILGGVVGALLVAQTDNTVILIVFLIAVAFLQFATIKVHYAIFIFFLTLLIVISGELAGTEAFYTSMYRIIATFIGVAVAFIVIIILGHIGKKGQNHSAQSKHGAESTGHS